MPTDYPPPVAGLLLSTAAVLWLCDMAYFSCKHAHLQLVTLAAAACSTKSVLVSLHVLCYINKLAILATLAQNLANPAGMQGQLVKLRLFPSIPARYGQDSLGRATQFADAA